MIPCSRIPDPVSQAVKAAHKQKRSYQQDQETEIWETTMTLLGSVHGCPSLPGPGFIALQGRRRWSAVLEQSQTLCR